jgi:hypothetical protein
LHLAHRAGIGALVGEEKGFRMRRREDRPIYKHTLNLFKGDYEWFQFHYGKIGAAKAIRDIVHAHRKKTEGLAADRIPAVNSEQFQLPLDEVLEKVDG